MLPAMQVSRGREHRSVWLAVGLVGALASAALAEPMPQQRVVLADSDRELLAAMERVLAPWQLEVVVDGAPPRSVDDARARAATDTARFVVWREGGQLVVYDREAATIERRETRAGALDPPAAAGAALSIKTMMRLPAEPALAAEPALVVEPVLMRPSRWRAQAGGALRVARGDETYASARLAIAVAARPWRVPIWLGASSDLGSASDVARAGFKGTWRDASLFATASWRHARDAWELEPLVAAGLRRSVLGGTESNADRDESDVLFALRGETWLRRRLGAWSAGVGAAIERDLGASTYAKAGAAATIFTVPSMAFELGASITFER